MVCFFYTILILQNHRHHRVGLHGELGANVVVSYNGGELAVRGAHHNKDDAAVGVFESDGVDVLAISGGSDSHGSALYELGKMSNVIVNGSENKFFGFGVVKDGSVAACRLVLKYDSRNRGGACGTVVEGSAFFAQEQVPVAKSCGKVVKVAAKLFAVSFSKRDGVLVNRSAVLGAEQNLAELFVHKSHAVKVVARIPVVANRPNTILDRLGREDLFGAVINALFVVVPNDDFDVGETFVIENGGEVFFNEFALIVGGVIAALPGLARDRLVLNGDCGNGNALFCHRLDVLGIVSCPALLVFFLQGAAAENAFVILHKCRGAPRGCEQNELILAIFQSVFDKGDDIFFVALEREGFELLVAALNVSVNVEREVAGVDMRSAKVVADAVFAGEIALQKELFLLIGELRIIVSRRLGKSAAKAQNALIFKLVKHVDNAHFGSFGGVACFNGCLLKIKVF